jgi:hypothetical protein
MNTNPEQPRRRRRKIYPDGIAIEPQEILQVDDSESSSCLTTTDQPQQQQQQCETGASATADLFVTMVSWSMNSCYDAIHPELFCLSLFQQTLYYKLSVDYVALDINLFIN